MSTASRSANPRLTIACLWLAAGLTAGCSNLELGLSPFYCNNGSPKCPDGYRCEDVAGISRGLCVKDGEQPPGIASDSAPPPDVDGGTPPPPADTGPEPGPRTVIVSEFMANPFAVDDSLGEYIELFNMTDAPIDINGWTLTDSGGDSHTIGTGSALVVLPKRYIVLGRSIDTGVNGGVGVAYALSNFTLGDAIDQILLIDNLGKIADKVGYSASAGFVIAEGASLSLKDPTRSSDAPSNWCVESTTWPGSAGDRGSPGSSPKCL